MPPPARTLWTDYLRSFITVLVVAHHASLAYTTFASFNAQAYILSTHPIVDSRRWVGLDIFENFNDVFFMSLMFFISGLFVLPALHKKGMAVFIRDRFYRLFVPFVFGVTVLMLLAYYPAYYVAHGRHDVKGYIIDYFTTEAWPVGPPWFIWELFAFNLLFALCYPFMKTTCARLSALLAQLKDKPLALAGIWWLLTWLLYVPLALKVGAGTWTGIGPFDFQLSRVLQYLGYFILGVLAGNVKQEAGIFSTGARWIKSWPLWIAACLLAYALLTVIPPFLTRMVKTGALPELPAWLIYYTIYVLSCTGSCLAFLASFRALAHTPRSWWSSLSANAYSIYLVHYIFVVWCQYALLSAGIPAFLKFLITFVVALLGSWLLSDGLRRHPLVKKYL
ncbi:acyltransferase family protein [Chitinophaga japonensis]|uniref:Acyltransferase-like protein n=1 Tax=Chitinophaga japonensis TaxID=104662 RepID=A0A562TB14_CHIJA|nr:acyltransferase [Chitinophaga japonensis]TWI90789.1 acyltransferase-like protein [Chitinophaga japonensis]